MSQQILSLREVQARRLTGGRRWLTLSDLLWSQITPHPAGLPANPVPTSPSGATSDPSWAPSVLICSSPHPGLGHAASPTWHILVPAV